MSRSEALKAARVNKRKKGQNKMLEEQSKNYKLALKQIKSLMNQVLTQLPAEEKKRVDKNIYYDSDKYGTPFCWNLKYLSSDDFKCLAAGSFYMYYKAEYQAPASIQLEQLIIKPAVQLVINPDKTLMAYAWNHDDLAAKAVFEGDLHALLDVLPSEFFGTAISQ